MLRGYRRTWLRGDLLAGVTVAAYLIPQVMAYAQVAGLPVAVPAPQLPDVHPADVQKLLLPAFSVLVVGFSDDVLTARSFAKPAEAMRANQELLALGAANVGASLLHGFPVSSSASRTAIAVATGSRSQVYSVAAAGSVLVAVFFLRPVLARFPAAALGAIVIYAAIRLIDVAAFRRLFAFRRGELVIALSACAGVLVLNILYGVLLAVAKSVADLLVRVARPHDAALGQVPGLAGMHDVDDYPTAQTIPGLVVYRYDAPLFFANAEDFRRRALATADRYAPVRWFVLNVEANVEVDFTALEAVDTVRRTLEQQGTIFALARVKQDLLARLDAFGLTGKIGSERLFRRCLLPCRLTGDGPASIRLAPSPAHPPDERSGTGRRTVLGLIATVRHFDGCGSSPGPQ